MPEDQAPHAANSSSELRDEPSNPPITDSQLAYKGLVWDIRRETFDYNGHPVVREFVDHRGAVAILAMNENKEVLLIQQYRHPVRARDWEVPAGLLDVVGEEPLAAAKRELEEEADLAASDWSELGFFNTSPGGSNETIRIFLATGLTAAPTVFDRREEEADIIVRWVPLAEAVEAVIDGRLHNSILALAVLSAYSRG